MNPPPLEIRVSTTPTFNSYLKFLMRLSFRQIRWLVLFAVLDVTFFLFIPIVPMEQQGIAAKYRAASPGLFLPAVVFVVIPLLTYYTARKRWRTAPELHEPRTYVFSENGIEIAGKTFDSRIQWTHIATAYKLRDLILLGTAQKQFYLLSVGDFQSSEKLNCFVELVRRKVIKCRL